MVSVSNQKQQAFISLCDFSERSMNQRTFQTSGHRPEHLALLTIYKTEKNIKQFILFVYVRKWEHKVPLSWIWCCVDATIELRILY